MSTPVPAQAQSRQLVNCSVCQNDVQADNRTQLVVNSVGHETVDADK